MCRLINPSKSEVGLVSKCYLSNIIADVKKKHQKLINGRKHWQSLIGLKILQINKFIKFDKDEFYPSISEDLLNKSINYAKSYLQQSKKMSSVQ